MVYARGSLHLGGGGRLASAWNHPDIEMRSRLGAEQVTCATWWYEIGDTSKKAIEFHSGTNERTTFLGCPFSSLYIDGQQSAQSTAKTHVVLVSTQ